MEVESPSNTISGKIPGKTIEFDFSMALHYLKEGKKVARIGWNNKNIWLELQRPDEHSKMTKPYIYMVKNDDKFPCDLSCESIMANDWDLVE